MSSDLSNSHNFFFRIKSLLLLLSRGKIHPDSPGRQANALVLRHLHAGVISLDEGNVHALGTQVGDGLVGELGLVLCVVRWQG